MSQSTLAAAGHGTVVPAPGNFRAVVNDDDSIDTSWNAVTGATYTLKELKSPDGVHDAIGISETHSHRTPHAHREYDYWVVAIKDGVESGESNHVKVSLPRGGTPPSQPTGSTPAEILQIGGAGGHWELGIGARVEDQPGLFAAAAPDKPDDNKILTVSEHGLVHGFAHKPYFMPTPDGTAVHFQAFMVGAIKPPHGNGHGSAFTRSELRELGSDGKTTTWNAKHGKHVLSGRTAVVHMPPKTRKICVAQIHGTVSDTLELRVESKHDGNATGGFQWIAKLSDGNVHGPAKASPIVKDDYTLGDEVAWEIKVADSGTVTVTIDGQSHVIGKAALDGQFFKTGCYTQSNKDKGNPEDESEAITLRDLRLSHS
jgi:predicted secreted protein